jgi:hypothetical protein
VQHIILQGVDGSFHRNSSNSLLILQAYDQ